MFDYKEILRKKAIHLRSLISKYGSQIAPDQLNSINVLIENTFEITDGRLDALDYDVRDKAIMNYHSQLDNAINQLSRFKENDNNLYL